MKLIYKNRNYIPEMYWETGNRGILKIKVFLKISNIHRETPVLESLFNKVAGLQTFKNTYFEDLRMTASV